MSDTAQDTGDHVRAEGAAAEREAILQIIERYARQLAHGHGATGALILEQIVEEIHRRGHDDSAG